MPAVARKSGTDKVFSPHGENSRTKPKYKMPSTQYTNVGSSRVFIDGIGVVRAGDPMTDHFMVGGLLHTAVAPTPPKLDSGSGRVFAEGRGIGRIGDVYGGEHPIISGSHRVFSA
jgi:hypothetical protein